MAIGLEGSNCRTGLVTRFAEMQECPVNYEVIKRDQAPDNVRREKWLMSFIRHE